MPENNLIKKEKTLFIAAVIGYLVSYVIFYIRYTYFASSDIMRFPIDMLAMTPACNDLYTSSTTAIKTLRAGTIVGVNFVYSPLFVIVYSALSLIPFYTLRWLSFITIISSYLTITLLFPKYSRFKISNIRIPLIIIFSGFLSYGLRFELERGQWNTQTLVLCFISFYLKDSKKTILIYLSYIFFTVAVHMKDWPIIFIFVFINPHEGWYLNIKRILIIGLINFVSLFVLGPKFLIEFVYKLAHATATPEPWIANISLFCFNVQASKLYNLDVNILHLFTYVYIAFFLISISLAYFKRISGSHPIIIYLCTTAGILLPTVSFDYKMCVLTICTAYFFSLYIPFSDVPALRLDTNKKSNKIKIFTSNTQIIEWLALFLILLSYPPTLYSYIYKTNLGFIGASDTTYVIIISIALMLLILAHPSQKKHII